MVATQRGTFSSLKVPNYRRYFVGQMISMCGTWMQSVGQAWLVLGLTGSGTALGLVTALQFLPVLLLGPFAGVLVDRLPKRRVLTVTQTVAGMLALVLAVLVATDTVQLWQVYVLAVGLGLVSTVDVPTRQIFVLEMVGKDDLNNAVTLNAVMVNTARVLGPALAGALISAFGLAVCFFINAASYVAVLVALALIAGDQLSPSPHATRGKGQLREGLRYVQSTPILRDAKRPRANRIPCCTDKIFRDDELLRHVFARIVVRVLVHRPHDQGRYRFPNGASISISDLPALEIRRRCAATDGRGF